MLKMLLPLHFLNGTTCCVAFSDHNSRMKNIKKTNHAIPIAMLVIHTKHFDKGLRPSSWKNLILCKKYHPLLATEQLSIIPR